MDSLERNLENVQLDLNIDPSNHVNVIYKNQFELESLSGLIPTILIIGTFIYMMRKSASLMGGKGGGLFGKFYYILNSVNHNKEEIFSSFF